MSNISDVIEAFLMSLLEDGEVNISRNELATYFSCAPSQINYVLSTRFTPARGFAVESRRGGGGYITVMRLGGDKSELLEELMSVPTAEGIAQGKAMQYLDRMVSEELISPREAELISSVMSDKALLAPAIVKDGLRAGMMKSLALQLLKDESEKEG